MKHVHTVRRGGRTELFWHRHGWRAWDHHAVGADAAHPVGDHQRLTLRNAKGQPERCDPATGVHSSPHRGCVLR